MHRTIGDVTSHVNVCRSDPVCTHSRRGNDDWLCRCVGGSIRRSDRNTQAQQLAGTVYPILDVIYYGDRDDAMGNSPIDRLIITEHVARIAAGLGTYSAQRLMCVRGQP